MPVLAWVALAVAVALLLAVDLAAAHRRPDGVGLREATAWSVLWLAVGVAFGFVLLGVADGEAAGAYWTGFLMEKALSIDNVFVIAVLLGAFAVPRSLQGDVLTFGIAGALVLRAAFIVAGVAVLEAFHPALYAFGALLVVTGARLAVKGEPAADVRDSRLLALLRRWLPVSAAFRGRRLVVREGGRRRATPLLAALVAVAAADVLFAVDSVPAVLAITTDAFIVFAANAFALLGLRALAVLVTGLADRLAYLHLGLAALLVLVGLKMLLADLVGSPPAGLSLAVAVAVLGAAIAASLLARGRAASRGEAGG